MALPYIKFMLASSWAQFPLAAVSHFSVWLLFLGNLEQGWAVQCIKPREDFLALLWICDYIYMYIYMWWLEPGYLSVHISWALGCVVTRLQLHFKINNIPCSPLIYHVNHLLTKEYDVGKVWSPLYKSMLLIPKTFLPFLCLEMAFSIIWLTALPNEVKPSSPKILGLPLCPWKREWCCLVLVLWNLPWSPWAFQNSREWPPNDISS